VDKIEVVNSFIKSLESKALYKLKGEKPIALISILSYLSNNNLGGIRLLDLLASPRHSFKIRSEFIKIASRYGKIADPEASWDVITGSARELQRAIENNGLVNNAFSELEIEQIKTLTKYWIGRLSESSPTNDKTPIIHQTKPMQTATKIIPKTESPLPPYLISNNMPNKVEVWSERRLPFEPIGWLKDLRSDIYNAVERLESNDNQVLRGVYSSSIDEKVDTENVLFYNVGLDCFTKSTRRGLIFECSFSIPNPTNISLQQYLHYHKYEVVPIMSEFAHWAKGNVIARWASVKCMSLLSASSIWYDMTNGQRQKVSDPSGDLQRFGLELIITGPNFTRSAQSYVKPLFDGVVSSLHRHDGSNNAAVSQRLATTLNSTPQQIESLLNDASFNVLGTRKLVWPWREGVQWNPSDENCVAGKILLNQDNSKNNYEMNGELYEVNVTK
jgi:hypothetical protein